MQAARREQALVESNEEARGIGGGHHRDVQVRLLDGGRGASPPPVSLGRNRIAKIRDGRHGAQYLHGPYRPREPTYHRRCLASSDWIGQAGFQVRGRAGHPSATARSPAPSTMRNGQALVARKMVLQVAPRDIGQLTDI